MYRYQYVAYVRRSIARAFYQKFGGVFDRLHGVRSFEVPARSIVAVKSATVLPLLSLSSPNLCRVTFPARCKGNIHLSFSLFLRYSDSNTPSMFTRRRYSGKTVQDCKRICLIRNAPIYSELFREHVFVLKHRLKTILASNDVTTRGPNTGDTACISYHEERRRRGQT